MISRKDFTRLVFSVSDIPFNDDTFKDFIKNKTVLGQSFIDRTSSPITLLESLVVLFEATGFPVSYIDCRDFIREETNYTNIGCSYIRAAYYGDFISMEDEPRLHDPITKSEAAQFIYELFNLNTNSLDFNEKLNLFLENESAKNLIRSYGEIRKNYFYKEDVDFTALLERTTTYMIKSLDEKYTKYISPYNHNNPYFLDPNNAKGIGFTYIEYKGDYVITTILENSPAERAGLRVGDFITAINGVSSSDLIEHPEDYEDWDTQTLTIRRNGKVFNVTETKEILDFSSIRGRDTIPKDLKWPSRVGYINILVFNYDTYQEFITELEQQIADGIDALVLDLRYNGGGSFDNALMIASTFLKKDVPILRVTNSAGQEVNFSSSHYSHLPKYQMPIVILANKFTVSAAEVLIEGLKLNSNVLLVGEDTFGKDSVQVIKQFNKGYGIQYTEGKLFPFTQLQRDEDNGIVPDIYIEEDLSDADDEVLFEILKRKLIN